MVHSPTLSVPVSEQSARQSRQESWFLRYKLYHIPFWMAYNFIWWTLRIGSPLEVARAIVTTPAATCKYLFYVVFQILGVCFNLYVLMPRLLDRGRYAQYIVAVLVTIILCAGLILGGYYAGPLVSDKSFQELYGRSPFDVYGLFESGSLPSTAAAMTLAMSIKLTKRWIEGRQRVQLLEQEKLETELKFLKSQFNPHFLFNTINSIFVLINKDPRQASDALAKFSDLLRYQLYECNEHVITLDQEVAYLENFVTLQRLRLEESVAVHFSNLSSQQRTFHIAPFMLMPFVENAFKHVSRNRNQTNSIDIALRLQESTLRLLVVNTTAGETARDVANVGGIGLPNVNRRLSLLYPDTHRLVIRNDGRTFEVSLELQLDSPVHDRYTDGRPT